MRIGYSEDEQFPGQFGLWQANCARQLLGKKGQTALKELEAALLALPSKRLIADQLVSENGDVCAIGALALHKGATTAQLAEEDDEAMEDVGESFGLPRLVAWKVVEYNDVDLESYSIRAPGPNQYGHSYHPGYSLVVSVTPEERYEYMLNWVRALLAKEAA